MNEKKNAEKTYHYGNLKETLLKEGLKMLNTEGIESFSMRKLATSLGVSHAAAYRHFKDKDELLLSIFSYSINEFYTALTKSVESISNQQQRITEMGVGYVVFFVKNPEMMNLYNLANELKIGLEDEIDDKGLPNTFQFFKNIVNKGMNVESFKGLSETEILLGLWSKVHGLASLLIFQHDLVKSLSDDELTAMVRRIISIRF